MTLRPNLLSTTRLALRVLIGLNFLYCAGLTAILITSFVVPLWLQTAIGFKADAPAALMIGIRLVVLIGIAAVPLGYLVFARLLAIVDAVRAGDPFVPANAARLQVIAQALLGVQILHLAVGGICTVVSTPENPFDIGSGDLSVDGWLAVLLTFILARVFDIGTRMRADLDGTV